MYQKGLDFYSQIAIDVFGLEEYSADPKAPNFLKKKNPKQRDKVKEFALAVIYGANAWRISQVLKISPQEAQRIIDQYLDTYPKLKDYMLNQENSAIEHGIVKTKFGRIRHLPRARDLHRIFGKKIFNKKEMVIDHGEEKGISLYYEFRNQMNNAKNFPIQGTGAHVTNAAVIKLAKLFQQHSIDGHIALNIHDEIVTYVRVDQVELAAKLLQDSMENNWATSKIDIPILAEPMFGNNFAEAK
jgi:DNA polymerase-1